MDKGVSWSNIAVGESVLSRLAPPHQPVLALPRWTPTFPILGVAGFQSATPLTTNCLSGATMNMFEVTTLGQPLEVLKTQMAANRKQSMGAAFRNVWSRGGVFGFYQGLIPWVSPHRLILLELRNFQTQMKKSPCL
jgi:hypothetical protein